MLASAQTNLSEEEIYDRCYLRMVRAVPPDTDPIMLRVQQKKITGAAACMELLDSALFKEDGSLKNPSNAATKAILRTFHDFHGSWFQSRISQVGLAQAFLTNALLADQEEPSLFITRALFGGHRYDSIVTSNEVLQGIRSRGNKANLSPFKSQRLISYPVRPGLPDFSSLINLVVAHNRFGTSTTIATTIPDSQLVPVGELVGVRPTTTFIIPAVRSSAAHKLITAADLERAALNVPVSVNHGGGIIGSSTFIMQNANLDLDIIPRDETYINRVTAARAFEDLLCHNLPTLTEADVENLVDPKSPLTFQQSASCMQCHAQIDPFAHGYRNLVLSLSAAFLTSPSSNTVGLPIQTFVKLPVNSESTLFAQKKPEATLHFRNFRSAKPSKVVVGNLQGLGANLALSQDLYECAAKRYYKFFTGIEVPLNELMPPPANASKESVVKHQLDSAHQKSVLEFAKALKEKQSLRGLIKDIISSSAFKSRHFNSMQEVQ